jgi:hypothetical protein
MKLFLPFIFLLCSFSLLAQGDGEWKPASKESEAYHDLRVRPSIPPYGLAKVRELVNKLKSDDDGNQALNTKSYESLSLREKFTYHMIHAESYSQNCDAMPPIQNEHKKIFPYIADAFNEAEWSERQTKFLSANRDSVMALIRESILRSKRVGVNYKHTIIEINAIELIPDLITVYHAKTRTKDLDLLTLMMQLMKENEFEPFLLSASYKKLYADDADYRAYLTYNKANEDLIIKRATEFYNANKK